MNKRQKAILKKRLRNEKEILKNIEEVYKTALLDVETSLKIYHDRILADGNDTSAIYQYEHQMAIKQQLDVILDKMNEENYQNISDYLLDCYEEGYLSTLYQIQGTGIPLLMPINQSMVFDAVMHNTKLKRPLYEALGYDVDKLKREISNELARGIIQGSAWTDIARNIRYKTKVSKNKAYTIARTEGARITSMAVIDSQEQAKEMGADIVKRWDATLDGKTRAEHRELDGQVREIDEDFEVAGYKAKGPLMFGIAHMDIRCRCASFTDPRWAMNKGKLYKRNSFTDELMEFDDNKSYEDFKKEFWSNENIKFMKYVQDLQKKHEITDFDLLKKAMTEKEYEKYSQLLKDSPIYGK